MKKAILMILIVSLGMFITGLIGWSIANKDMTAYWMKMASLTMELEECKSGNTTHGQIANTWQPDIAINDLLTTNITPSGFHATFTTPEKQDYLLVFWTVYPSDMFSGEMCKNEDACHHSFTIKTYPEGGTVIWRIERRDTTLGFSNHGTDWFYQDLPRLEEDTVLSPPYYKPQ